MPLKALTIVLFTLLTLAVAAVSHGQGSNTTTSPAPPVSAGAESMLLSTGAHYLETILNNTLTSLQLIATTPEAKNGDWPGIKRYLQQLAPALPGAYFYLLPDGNYYSLTMDYTNLNLSDRPYFQPLFGGNPVRGFPIFSRSTGKKSAFVAAPIMVDKNVTGALGVSVFLEELHTQLDRAFALPANYTWFVLDATGNTMLNHNSDLIFMNALRQGSPSLREGVAAALQRESGTIQYELGAHRIAWYQKLPSLDWWLFIAEVQGEEPPPPPPLAHSLATFVPALQEILNRIDGSLNGLIEASRLPLYQESDLRKLLTGVLRDNPEVITASFIDAQGILRYMMPSDYRNFENVDISSQKHVATMLQDHQPGFSDSFKAIEGFSAVTITRPLFDSANHFIGAINPVLRPELLIKSLLKQRPLPANYELWLMQPDGRIIYDQNPEEIGRMLFSDPLYAGYEGLLKLGKEIAAAPSGEGSYIFLAANAPEPVIKKALWQTVRLHNQEWRVVLAYRQFDK